MLHVLQVFFRFWSRDKATHCRANGADWSVDTGLSSRSLGSTWATGSSGSNLSLCAAEREESERGRKDP